MKIQTTLRLAAIALVLVLMGPAMFAAGDETVTSSKFYKVHYLRPPMVEVLGKQACGGQFMHQQCNMSWGSEGFVQFTGSEEQQDTFAAALAERDMPPPTQIFQVHVLRAKTESKEMPPLPLNAVQALMDLQQLLPYKGFELLDSGLMRTSGEAQLYLGSERRYQAHLQFEGDPEAGKPLQIQFSLVADRVLPKAVRGDDADAGVAGTVRLIATTFSMKVGETVVVGTSKLNGGNEALVVLLSAGS
jgi:hypothetical protein